jgi:hypothetical protein
MLTFKLFRQWIKYTTASHRAAKMDRGELMDFIDTHISMLGTSFDTYRRYKTVSSSYDMLQTSLTLAVMCSELHSRHNK